MQCGILQSDLVVESDTVAFALYESIRNHVQLASTAVHAERFEDSIKHFDSAIKQATEKITAVLFAHRAHSFEKLQQYDMMLADAKRVIECFPTSAYGYIQTARALCHKQERRDALMVYDTGLKTVSPDDPQYQTLVSLKDSLVAEIDQRNFSLLGRLPYDVFDQIFSQLSVIDRTRCTRTCKSWRKMLLNWDKMWKKVDVKCIADKTLLDCIKGIDGRKVRELSIDLCMDDDDDLCEDDENANMLNALVQNGYNQLQVLDIWDLKDVPQAPFKSLLESNCQSITTLALEMVDSSLLEIALKTCQNLTRLRCDRVSSSSDRSGNDLTLPEQPLKLTHLEFHWDYEDDPLDILESILSLCPDLKYFATTSDTFDNEERNTVLGLVHEYCPSLLQFRMGSSEYLQEHPTLSIMDSDTRGIIDISDAPSLNSDELQPLLSRQRQTLEALRLDLSNTTYPHHVLRSVAALRGFPKLREIELVESDNDPFSEEITESDEDDDDEEDGNELIWPNTKEVTSIIRRCPLLETVRLAGFYFNNKLYPTLGKLEHLRHLELLECDGVTTIATINEFFQRAVALEVFTYQENPDSRDEGSDFVGELLLAISRSRQKPLKELRLLSCTTFREFHVSIFASNMEYGQLSRLSFCNAPLEQKILKRFLEIPSLRLLRLECVRPADCVDVSLALEGRSEPICVVFKTYAKGKQSMNGTYIKDKDGHVKFYPKRI